MIAELLAVAALSCKPHKGPWPDPPPGSHKCIRSLLPSDPRMICVGQGTFISCLTAVPTALVDAAEPRRRP